MLLDRIIGVFKLDANTFEEIEADRTATTQAALVVAIVAIVGGIIGAGLGTLVGGGNFLPTFLSILINAFASWIVWSVVTYFVGTTLFGGQATLDEMLRVIGFAQAPGILVVIPVCGAFLGWIWSIAAGFVAVRQGLDLDNTKAFFTVIIGFVAVLIISIVVSAIFGAGAVALNAITG